MSEMHLQHAVRGILFDKDGTLIDFNSAWIPAGIKTAQRLCELAGSPQHFDGLIAQAGYQPHNKVLAPESMWACGTTRELLEQWIHELGLDNTDELVDENLDFMTEVARVHSQPVTDLKALFNDLKNNHCSLGVATMDLASAAKAILERFGVHEQVDFVCGCDSGFGHKPDPGMVLEFCKARDLRPQEVLVIGDTPHDLQMGRAAQVGTVVAVLTGVASREMLEPHADFVLDSIAGLRELIVTGH